MLYTSKIQTLYLTLGFGSLFLFMINRQHFRQSFYPASSRPTGFHFSTYRYSTFDLCIFLRFPFMAFGHLGLRRYYFFLLEANTADVALSDHR